jgi:hypothetical protein
MPGFVPGLTLSGFFYHEAVRPLLDARFPGLPHAAARLGLGSDVLGFDTPMSMDHGWGPKVTLFLREEDFTRFGGEIGRVMGDELPFTVCGGFPTHLDAAAGQMRLTGTRPTRHGVAITTVPRFFLEYLGLDLGDAMSPAVWLTMPAQRLRTVASGRVFHDEVGVDEVRRTLAWYPHDIWLYLLAAQWRRLAQEEAFVGRTGDVGDDAGSRLITARLVHEMMQLAFLCEREFPPYAKWFGTAFSRLHSAPRLAPALDASLAATHWREREQRLGEAFVLCGEMHNALGVTGPVEPRMAQFHARPYSVPHADRFADALVAAITAPEVRALPSFVGAAWQFADSTDLLDQARILEQFTGNHRVADLCLCREASVFVNRLAQMMFVRFVSPQTRISR